MLNSAYLGTGGGVDISRAADGGLAGATLLGNMALTFSFTTVDVYGDEQ